MLRNCSFYLAKIIDKDENADLKVIEYRKSRCIEVAEMLENALILNGGDGTDVNLLREENIEDMDVVIAVTDNDEKTFSVPCSQSKWEQKK